MHERVVGSGRFEVENHRQIAVVDDDQLGRVARRFAGLGDDDGDTFTREVDRPDRQRPVLGVLHVFGHRPRARQWVLERVAEVGAGEHCDDAGYRGRGARVDAGDLRVRDGAADDAHRERARDLEIVDEPGLAGEQRRVFAPQLARAQHRGHLLRAHRLGRGEHGLHDVVVAGTTAQVAFEAEPDVVLARVRNLVEQRDRGEHHARGAVAALEAVVLVERLLDGVPLLSVGQAFDRRDRRAVGLRGEHRARLHRLTLDQHGARAARRRVAPDLGAGETTRLPEVLHEQGAGFYIVLLRRPVDRDTDLHHCSPSPGSKSTLQPYSRTRAGSLPGWSINPNDQGPRA